MIELNHCFDQEFLEPAVKIRLYLDAQLAEVVSDQTRLPIASVFKNKGSSLDIMNYKWRLNYFLQTWLDHCLKKDYQFNASKAYAATLCN